MSCRLALASVLVQHGSPNFDSLTDTSAVSELLQGLGKESIVSHMKFLCGVIGGSSQSSEHHEDSMAESALETLALLAKNNKLELRNYIAILVIGVLLRLSCFGTARPKRKKSKVLLTDLPEDISSVLNDFLDEIDKHVEQGESLRETASLKLLSLLADIGFLTYEKNLTDEKGSQAPVFLDYAAAILQRLSSSYTFVRDEEANDTPGALTKVPFHTLLSISANNTSSHRIIAAAKNAVTFTTVHVLCNDELDLQVSLVIGLRLLYSPVA